MKKTTTKTKQSIQKKEEPKTPVKKEIGPTFDFASEYRDLYEDGFQAKLMIENNMESEKIIIDTL